MANPRHIISDKLPLEQLRVEIANALTDKKNFGVLLDSGQELDEILLQIGPVNIRRYGDGLTTIDVAPLKGDTKASMKSLKKKFDYITFALPEGQYELNPGPAADASGKEVKHLAAKHRRYKEWFKSDDRITINTDPKMRDAKGRSTEGFILNIDKQERLYGRRGVKDVPFRVWEDEFNKYKERRIKNDFLNQIEGTNHQTPDVQFEWNGQNYTIQKGGTGRFKIDGISYQLTPSKYRADKEGFRRAMLLDLTPNMSEVEWLQINQMYDFANRSNGKFQVDHIIPLSQGGLHHPSNLQILTSGDNLLKGDRIADWGEFWPEPYTQEFLAEPVDRSSVNRAVKMADPELTSQWNARTKFGGLTRLASGLSKADIATNIGVGLGTGNYAQAGLGTLFLAADNAHVQKRVGQLAAKLAAERAGKSALKLIPGLDIAISGAEAWNYAMRGKWDQAGIAAASGAVGWIPGIGDAAAAGLDLTNTGLDIARGEHRRVAPDDPEIDNIYQKNKNLRHVGSTIGRAL
tara:strand:+ start:44 stop:1600 length:1557 start_codon:yes stop_codon:yes gene_type:complete